MRKKQQIESRRRARLRGRKHHRAGSHRDAIRVSRTLHAERMKAHRGIVENAGVPWWLRGVISTLRKLGGSWT